MRWIVGTGGESVILGYEALRLNTTGYRNVAIGARPLWNNTTGVGNVAIGAETLISAISGNINIAIGDNTAKYITTGSYNTVIGPGSGLNGLTTGSYNTIIGGSIASFGDVSNNIVLADGQGNIKYKWDGTNNNFYGNAIFSGNITASTIVKSGGTSSQFLKADGSVDSSVYALDSAVVKLTGDQTIAGVKTFSNRIVVDTDLVTSNVMFLKNANSNGYGLSIQAGFGTNYSLYVANNVGAKAFEVLSNGTTNILGTTTIGNFDGLALKMQAGTSTGNSFLRFYNSAGSTRGYFGLFNSSGTDYMLLDGSSVDVTINGSSNLNLQTGGSNRLTITSSGNVGIGTTSPTAFGGYTTLTIDNSSGSFTEYRQAGSNSFRVGSNETNGGFLYTQGSTPIRFGTVDTERMRITSGGYLLVGTTTAFNPGFTVSQSGFFGTTVTSGTNIQIWNQATSGNNEFVTFYTEGGGGALRGTITYNRGAGLVSYNVTSDYRLKTDLQEFNGNDILNKIKIYDYKLKETGSRVYGVMAHELAEVLPYSVTGVKDGEQMQGVDYSKIVPVAIKAIQETDSKVVQLEKKIVILEAEIQTLKNK